MDKEIYKFLVCLEGSFYITRGGTRHSLEQRLEIVTKYLNVEEPLARLSNHYHVSKSTIERWYEKYESNGLDGLKKTHNNKKYDPEFKLEMVHVVLSGLCPYNWCKF